MNELDMESVKKLLGPRLPKKGDRFKIFTGEPFGIFRNGPIKPKVIYQTSLNHNLFN